MNDLDRLGPKYAWLRRVALIVVFVQAGLLVWSRIAGLGVSLWNDELATVIHWVQHDPQTILAGKYTTNNHVFFSLLSWLSVAIFGAYEAAYRAPAAVLGTAAALLLIWWLWHRWGAVTAAIFSTFILVAPLHLELTPQARGYGVAFAATAALIVTADRVINSDRILDWVLLGIAGFVGIATLPIFVPAFVTTTLVLAVASPLRRRSIFLLVVVGVASLVWYAPSLVELLGSVSQEHGELLPWHGPITAWPRHLVSGLGIVGNAGLPGKAADPRVGTTFELLRTYGRHMMGTVALALLIGLTYTSVVAGAVRLWRHRQALLVGILALPVLVTYAVVTGFGLYVEERFLSFLLIPVLVLLAFGVRELLHVAARIHRAVGYAALSAVSLAVVILLTGFTQVVRPVVTLPRENFLQVAEIVNRSNIDDVVTNSVRPMGLHWYLEPPVEPLKDADVPAVLCEKAGQFVFIDHRFRKEEPVDTACLEERGAMRTRVIQRSHGGFIDVWFVPGRSPNASSA